MIISLVLERTAVYQGLEKNIYRKKRIFENIELFFGKKTPKKHVLPHKKPKIFFHFFPRRCDEASLSLADLESAKKKLSAENAELLRQVEEVENANITAQKIR